MAIGFGTSEIPLNCGKRLIAHYIHQLAIDEPDRVCMSMPLTSEPRDGFKDLTFFDLDKAIDVASFWIEEHFGTGKDFECIAYIGPHDLGHGLNKTVSQISSHNLSCR